jgi:hypothetical protein
MERDVPGFEHISVILSRMLKQEPVSCELPEEPFDSPIEAAFAESCFKFLSPAVHVQQQRKVSTTHGSFRLDFLMLVKGRKIAVECDGKDFHEGLRDELRDAILLGEGKCETIYHFRGCDLVYHPYDCVWLMSVLDKDLFSQRGHIQLNQLRCLPLDLRYEDIEQDESFHCYSGLPSSSFWAFRRSKNLVENNPKLNYHWIALYKFSLRYPEASLDKLLNIRISR